MGYVRHNAIVVTSRNEKAIAKAAMMAGSLGLTFLGPSPPAINGYCSLLICPDGSKEGWQESDQGDERRKRFREYLDSERYEDFSTSLEWCEIAYGSDDSEAKVISHAWKTRVCDLCNGTEKYDDDDCPTCHGTGELPSGVNDT